MRRTWGAVTAAALMLMLVPAGPARAGEGDIDGEGKVHAGVYSPHWEVARDLEAMAQWAGKRVSFGGVFHTLGPEGPPGEDLLWRLEETWGGRATPFLNVMIEGSAADIAAGRHDLEIVELARQIEEWLARGEGRSLIIAPLQEMNGHWVPYGMDPASYPAAYRRFPVIFADRGIDETEVRWAFAPNGWSARPHRIADYYPGDEVVDVVGVSAFNFGRAVQGRWWGVEEAVGGALAELRSFVPHKPYLIAQTGTSSSGGDKDAWVRELFELAVRDPNVVGLIYFNFHKETDWAVWDEDPSPGWREALQWTETVYEWPLESWFRPGPLRFRTEEGEPPCPPGSTCDSVALVDGRGDFHLLEEVAWAPFVARFPFGHPEDVPLMGDWDCDGRRTPAVYRQAEALLLLRNRIGAGDPEAEVVFGAPGDLPVVGDWNGDGCDAVGVYRPGEGTFHLADRLGSPTADRSFALGRPGDLPVAGDWDGDGRDGVGVYRPGEGTFHLRQVAAAGPPDLGFHFGEPGDVAVAGDWNGDGVDTPALYRRSTGRLYVRLANADGAADYVVTVGGYRAVLRGQTHTRPEPVTVVLPEVVLRCSEVPSGGGSGPRALC